MKNKDEIDSLLAYLAESGTAISADSRESLAVALSDNIDQQTLPIKVLSIFGGILASIAFLGFLFVAGLYSSETGMLICGALCIALAIGIQRRSEKILLDTISVSLYIIGYLLFVAGLVQLQVGDTGAASLVLAASTACLFIGEGYIIRFLSVLIANGAIVTLIIANDLYDALHGLVTALALLITWLFLNEAKFLAAEKPWRTLYDPLRTALLLSLLGCLAGLGKRGLLPLSPHYIWLSSVGIAVSILIVVYQLFQILNVTGQRTRAFIFVLSCLLLLPSAASPAICGSVLIILLAFLVNHRTGLVLGIVSFVYFVSQYYYDLHLTLLTKSVLLFLSGAFFLLIYFLTYKKLATDDED